MIGNIYFVQIEFNGPIKIGFATNVIGRIKQIETAIPWNLELIGSIIGDPPHEKLLHKIFAKYRIRREWYYPEKDLTEAIEIILSSWQLWENIRLINGQYFLFTRGFSYENRKYRNAASQIITN